MKRSDRRLDDRRGPPTESGGDLLDHYPNSTQQAIVRAAIPLLRDHGYNGTSVNDICASASLTKPTFYYYFDTKLSLLGSLVEASLAMTEKALAKADDGDGTPLDRLKKLIETYTEQVCDRPALWTIHYAERDLLPDSMAHTVRKRERTIVARFEGIIAEGVKKGDFRETQPFATAMALIGMSSWLHRWYRKGGLLGPKDFAAVFEVLIDGLARGALGEKPL